MEINQPLTNAQLEILKAFSHDLTAKELEQFRALLARFFADRAIQAADSAWEEKGWDDSKVEVILQTKLRTRRI